MNKHLSKTKQIPLNPFNLLQLNKNKNILKRAIEAWGTQAQLEMIIEELLELALALQQAKRESKDPDKTGQQILDEIADVTIMISQAWLIFPSETLRQYVDNKMDRLNKTLDKLEKQKAEHQKLIDNFGPKKIEEENNERSDG